MTSAYVYLGLTLLTPYLFTVIAKVGGGFSPGANADPRSYLEQLTGLKRRADCAQKNSFEVLPAFSAALLMAHQLERIPQGTLDQLALAFLLSRLAYGACYLTNWALPRSLCWFAGVGIIAALFVMSA